jgi:hypothetical protein
MGKFRFASVAVLGVVVVVSCSDGGGANGGVQSDLIGPAAEVVASRGDRDSGDRDIAVLDDCDPRDPAWAPTGGCALRRGNVTLAEFNALLASPLSSAVVGHPAWRNQPSYLEIEDDKSARVSNEGGRLHTFTRVAQFGGGRVPPLNMGLTPAPECILAPGAVDRTAVAPGARLEVKNLALGIHRFQCCIHPWMRALIRVEADADDDDDDGERRGHGGH